MTHAIINICGYYKVVYIADLVGNNYQVEAMGSMEFCNQKFSELAEARKDDWKSTFELNKFQN